MIFELRALSGKLIGWKIMSFSGWLTAFLGLHRFLSPAPGRLRGAHQDARMNSSAFATINLRIYTAGLALPATPWNATPTGVQ